MAPLRSRLFCDGFRQWMLHASRAGSTRPEGPTRHAAHAPAHTHLHARTGVCLQTEPWSAEPFSSMALLRVCLIHLVMAHLPIWIMCPSGEGPGAPPLPRLDTGSYSENDAYREKARWTSQRLGTMPYTH